jgi:hypothetical protein
MFMKWGRGERSAFSKSRVFHDGPDDTVERISNVHYNQMGQGLQVPAPNIRAISIIESAEKAMTPNGNPVVRFENHIWKRYRLASRLGQSFDKMTNSGDLDDRWAQFDAMHRVDPVAAVKSHSFGWPQIMGFNHKHAGFETTESFLSAMMTTEGQCKAFVQFCQNSPSLLAALRKGDADAVGLNYNGRNYQQNRYAQKFANLSQRGLSA